MNYKKEIEWGGIIFGAILVLLGLVGICRYLDGGTVTIRWLCGSPFIIIVGIVFIVRGFKRENSGHQKETLPTAAARVEPVKQNQPVSEPPLTKPTQPKKPPVSKSGRDQPKTKPTWAYIVLALGIVLLLISVFICLVVPAYFFLVDQAVQIHDLLLWTAMCLLPTIIIGVILLIVSLIRLLRK